MDNCPNCGAPITSAVCEYCGTHHAQDKKQVTISVERDYTDIVSWDGYEVYRVWHKPKAKVVGE